MTTATMEKTKMDEATQARVDLYEAKLKEWRSELEKLEARAEQKGAEAKVAYHDKVKELQGKEKDFRSKLEELKKGGSLALEDLKKGAEGAWENLRKSYEAAFARFR